MREINPGYFDDSEFIVDMRSEISYSARPSLARAAVGWIKVQRQVGRFAGRLTCACSAFNRSLFNSRHSSNIGSFPFFNCGINFLIKQINNVVLFEGWLFVNAQMLV
jgi:hypothetical protein